MTMTLSLSAIADGIVVCLPLLFCVILVVNKFTEGGATAADAANATDATVEETLPVLQDNIVETEVESGGDAQDDDLRSGRSSSCSEMIFDWCLTLWGLCFIWRSTFWIIWLAYKTFVWNGKEDMTLSLSSYADGMVVLPFFLSVIPMSCYLCVICVKFTKGGATAADATDTTVEETLPLNVVETEVEPGDAQDDDSRSDHSSSSAKLIVVMSITLFFIWGFCVMWKSTCWIIWLFYETFVWNGKEDMTLSLSSYADGIVVLLMPCFLVRELLNHDGAMESTRVGQAQKRARKEEQRQKKAAAKRMGCRSVSFFDLLQLTSEDGAAAPDTTAEEALPRHQDNAVEREVEPDDAHDDNSQDDNSTSGASYGNTCVKLMVNGYSLLWALCALWRFTFWTIWLVYKTFMWMWSGKYGMLFLVGLGALGFCLRTARLYSLQPHEPTFKQKTIGALTLFVIVILGLRSVLSKEQHALIQTFTWWKALLLVPAVLVLQLSTQKVGEALAAWYQPDNRTCFDNWLEERGSEPTDEQCKELLYTITEGGKKLCIRKTPFCISPTSSEHPLVVWNEGVRVEWLRDVFFRIPFVNMMVEYGCPLWYFRDVVLTEFLQHNGYNGHALVDWAKNEFGEGDTRRSSQIATAPNPNKFVSYTGAYKLKTMRDAIGRFSPGTIIWLDIFNVNQYVWRSKLPAAMEQKQTFRKSLGHAIGTIQCTHLLIDDWTTAFDTLEKIWVVWEIFLTVRSNASLEIASPSSAQRKMRYDTMIAGRSFLNTIIKIDVLKAKASKEEDRVAILDAVRDYGADEVNELVKLKMCAWNEETLRQILQNGTLKEEETMVIDRLIAESLIFQGETSRAIDLLKESLKSHILPTSSSSQGTEDAKRSRKRCVRSLSLLVEALVDIGDFEAAKLFCARLVTEQKLIDGDDGRSLESFLAVYQLGYIFLRQRRIEESRSCYLQCLEHAPSSENPIAQFALREWLGKLEYISHHVAAARDIFERLYMDVKIDLGENHPHTMRILQSYIHGLLLTGEHHGVVPLAAKLYKSRQDVFGEEHTLTAESLHLLKWVEAGHCSAPDDWIPILEKVPLKRMLEQRASLNAVDGEDIMITLLSN